jgi:hypothetical protein
VAARWVTVQVSFRWCRDAARAECQQTRVSLACASVWPRRGSYTVVHEMVESYERVYEIGYFDRAKVGESTFRREKPTRASLSAWRDPDIENTHMIVIFVTPRYEIVSRSGLADVAVGVYLRSRSHTPICACLSPITAG